MLRISQINFISLITFFMYRVKFTLYLYSYEIQECKIINFKDNSFYFPFLRTRLF